MFKIFKKKEKDKETGMFIGFYGFSVVLTYLSVISASFGIYFALNVKVLYAVICLIISGVCDGFDGKVARACKRSETEKMFGLQIDSLADLVAFGFLPVAIGYGLGFNQVGNVVVYTLYILAACIRLGYFNVIAEDSAKASLGVKYYHGLPVTSAAAIFPLLYLVKSCISFSNFAVAFTLTMAFTALLFVLDFKLKKPNSKMPYVFLVIGILGIILLWFKG